MKKILLFFLLALAPGLTPLFASAEDTLLGDAENFLDIRGRVLESQGQEHDQEKKGLDSAAVTVTNESGKAVIFGYTDSKGRLAFRLPLGRQFTISVTKSGFVKKMISVDTRVPYEARKVFVFTFDLDIFEEVNGLDVSVLEKPVARIAYKAMDKNFSYDAAYTNKVNAGLQKMYRDYYALKRKEKQELDSVPASRQPAPRKSRAGVRRGLD